MGISPECFGHLTQMLMTVAHLNSASPKTEEILTNSSAKRQTRQTQPNRKKSELFSGGLILALEGGYHVEALAKAVCFSVASLLGDACPRLSFSMSLTDT